MSEKKAKPPAVRYLLSADRRLQKLSLRKISDRAKNAKGPVRSGSKPSAAVADSSRSRRASSSYAIALAVILVAAAAALIATRQQPQTSDVASGRARSDADARLQPAATPLPASKSVATASVPATAAGAGKAAGAEPAKAAAVPSKTKALEAARKTTLVEAAPHADGQNVAPVTITGCLQRESGTYSLKDTAGVNAPKSRGWRSGFLKKRPAPVKLVDPANKLSLADYLGQRIAATGTLVDRKMEAQWVRRVAGACN